VKKKDLANKLSEEFDLTKVGSQKIIDFIFKAITRAAQSKDPYHHANFGKFVVVEREQRVIHNVNTGELIQLPKKKLLRFVPSRRLNKSLNSKTKRRNK